MCSIFSNIDPKRYAYETRSVRLSGHATSIRLETEFWGLLEEMAALQKVGVGRLLTQLHDEVLDFSGEATNFTSMLRCACVTYAAERRIAPLFARDLLEGPRRDFPLADKSAVSVLA